jgi:hypothetical protein
MERNELRDVFQKNLIRSSCALIQLCLRALDLAEASNGREALHAPRLELFGHSAHRQPNISDRRADRRGELGQSGDRSQGRRQG